MLLGSGEGKIPNIALSGALTPPKKLRLLLLEQKSQHIGFIFGDKPV